MMQALLTHHPFKDSLYRGQKNQSKNPAKTKTVFSKDFLTGFLGVEAVNVQASVFRYHFQDFQAGVEEGFPSPFQDQAVEGPVEGEPRPLQLQLLLALLRLVAAVLNLHLRLVQVGALLNRHRQVVGAEALPNLL